MKIRMSIDSVPLYSIIPIEESKRAALILSNYLVKITGANFKICHNHCESSKVVFKLTDQFGESGFSYEPLDRDISISAANEQAFVYAVYDILERVVGCRFYSRECEYIPLKVNLEFDMLQYSFYPPIDYREVYYKEFEDKEFAEKLTASEKHEGWGFWCHSFQKLLPNEQYFNQHPEYFACIDGERNPKGEPCLTNPEVRKIMLENLRTFIQERPECKYWSVSQNDDNLYCRCPECMKRDEIDNSQIGTILDFVNEVAREFPDKIISTLAYWYSRKPPKVTRPLDNVHIMLCNIEAFRGKPIETDPENEGSRQELIEWAKICGNVSLWDYGIQFWNLVSPFPNLRVIGPNMRFFVKNNVKLLFSQCNREIGGEFCELRGYMFAKLSWDPFCDECAVMEDFCIGFYGAAAEYILEYINIMHDAMEMGNESLGIFKGPKDAKETYLTPELCRGYHNLFHKAEQSVEMDEVLLKRVQTARAPLYYACIVLEYGNVEERMDMIRKFAYVARKTNLKMVEELKITVDQFVTDSIAALGITESDGD